MTRGLFGQIDVPADPLARVPYQPHSESSKAAAHRQSREARDADRQRILDALAAAGRRGMTDDELQVSLALDGNTERPRRGELQEQGLVMPRPWVFGCGEREQDYRGQSVVARPTRTGSLATVWIAKGATR